MKNEKIHYTDIPGSWMVNPTVFGNPLSEADICRCVF